ncbi:hypothetical protein T492DRAFT_867154 [Pavlovales sp. CCMP2436]|nr:hypothetical protein T492DRAFT_867154 [Pavlovales sp. CCMP2436]
MEFLADSHQALEVFPTITSPRVLRISLWLLGEYCTDAEPKLFGLGMTGRLITW